MGSYVVRSTLRNKLRKRLILIDSFDDAPEERLVKLTAFDCEMSHLLEIPNHPHRACVSCHEVPYATGLIRNELMLLIGMMMIRMLRKEEDFVDDHTFPVSSQYT